jgi:hypothetical protein
VFGLELQESELIPELKFPLALLLVLTHPIHESTLRPIQSQSGGKMETDAES